MMEAMPRPRPPHLHRQVTRHTVRRSGMSVSARGCASAYELTLAQWSSMKNTAPPFRALHVRRGALSGTLAWLIERYRETGAWTGLSAATRTSSCTF